jgi:uncharacterized membrane protein YfcA
VNIVQDWLHVPSVFESALLLISIGAGIFGAILGLGGGVIIVPVLSLGFGINLHYAIGASIVSVIATSSGAAVAYLKDHVTNIRVAMLLEVATTIGALSGALVSPYLSAQALYLIFSLVLFYSALLMYRKRENHADTHSDDWFANKLRLNSSYPDHNLGKEIEYTVTRIPFGLCLMYLAGIISGLLGVGSGVLKVPAMDTAMRLPIKVSSATSSFMIGVTAAASAGAYYMRGDIIPVIAAPVAVGVLIGSRLGTRIMMKLSGGTLRRIFLGVLLLVALEMGLKGLGVSLR